MTSLLSHNYREILVGLGENPEREGLLDTSKRAAKALQHLCRSYAQGIERSSTVLFASDNDELVIVNDIVGTIQEVARAAKVAVVIEAQHICMVMCGVEKQNSSMMTSVMLGAFRESSTTCQNSCN